LKRMMMYGLADFKFSKCSLDKQPQFTAGAGQTLWPLS